METNGALAANVITTMSSTADVSAFVHSICGFSRFHFVFLLSICFTFMGERFEEGTFVGGMSSFTALELSVSGAKIRPFVSLLSVCVKMSSGGFFLEPSPSAIAFRVVSDSKSSHFIAEVPSGYFDSYKYERPVGSDALNLQLVSRGIAASILRFCPTVARLVLMYETSGSQSSVPAAQSQDVITFIMYCHSGTMKTFRLHLGEDTVSEKADVRSTDEAMSFRAIAEPRLWYSLVTNFAPTTKTWTVHPTELRLTVTDEGDEGYMASSESNRNAAVVSADSRSFLHYLFPTQSNPDGQAGIPLQAVVLPGKTFELRPLKWFLIIADALQLQVQLSTGDATVPAVHIEGIRKQGGPGMDSMVSFVSLLVAAADHEPSRAQSASQGRPSSHTPAAQKRPSGSVGMLQGATSNIRSASMFADHRPEPIMSAAPTAFGDVLRTQSSRAESVLAPASAYGGEGRSSAAFTAVAPSFVEATPSPQKRARCCDDDDSFCIPGSVHRSSSNTSHTKSYVEGTADGGGDPQRSASKDVPASFPSSRGVPSSHNNNNNARDSPDHTGVVASTNLLMQMFPLDFDALGSDEEDGDDDNFALENFIASRCTAEQQQQCRSSTGEGFAAASTYMLVDGTQRK